MVDLKNIGKIYKRQLAILPRLHTLDVLRMLDNLNARILKIGPKGNLRYCVDGYSKMAAVMLENALGDIGAEKRIDECRKKSDTGFEFDGGRVEYDPDEIRYNIFFDDIPDQDKWKKLKIYGFKWSPRRQAWTRGAKTMNADRIKSILGV